MGRPSACSGDMYRGVPKKCRPGVRCPWSWASLAIPKSRIFGSPERSLMMLAGFTSRCTTPAPWAWCSASATRCARRNASRQGRGEEGETISERACPSRYSRAMKRIPVSGSRPTSCTTTMLGWARRAAIWASAKNRRSKASCSCGATGKASWMALRAMVRPRTVSVAS